MMNIIVDFDMTCASHDYPNGGFEVPGAAKVLRKLVENDHKIILFTIRSDKGVEMGLFKSGLTDSVKWFEDNEIPLFGIQENPDQKGWTDSPKPHGQVIIDDAAIGIPLTSDPELGEGQFVDWVEVEVLLYKKGLI